MNKKHYKLMAEACAGLRRCIEDGELIAANRLDIMDEVEDEVCIILQHDNPSFDYEKFTDASGRKD